MLWVSLALLAVQPELSEEEHRELRYWNAVAAERGESLRTEEEFLAQKATWKAQAEEHEKQRLRGAGFESAAILQRRGKSLIRATFTEPRLFLRMPGVTLERQGDGRTRITLSSDGRAKVGSALLPEATVDELEALEKEAFEADAPPAYLAWKPGDPLPPRPETISVCHAWGVVLERISRTGSEKVWGHGCYSQRAKPRLDYATKLAWAAIDAFPQCSGVAPNADPMWSLGECFGKFEPATSDNP